MSISKKFIDSNDLLKDSYRLANKILASGFHPDFIVGVWRGGAPVGIAVQEFFKYHGFNCDHTSVVTSSYEGINQQSKTIKVHSLDYLIKTANAEDSLLIIDDVFDSGKSIAALIAEITQKSRKNIPHDIRIAVPWYKPQNSKVNFKPDYYLHETDEWLVFPHELEDLTEEEIMQGKPELNEISDLFKKKS